MWANAQRDDRPAKYRCRSPRKAWLTPTTRVACSNAAKTRKPLKFAGVPKLPNRSQPPWAEVRHIVRRCGGHIAA